MVGFKCVVEQLSVWGFVFRLLGNNSKVDYGIYLIRLYFPGSILYVAKLGLFPS